MLFMEQTIDFENPTLLRYFLEICRIPRASGKEARIADYLCAFAISHGLSYHRDDVLNVLICRDATQGYESHEPVGLQGHTDMVCEKEPSVDHDFDVDPIRVYEQDGWLHADGTTLGADNGVAVASMLTLLADPDYRGPALECLFTADEESGMTGAKAFDTALLRAPRVINLDTERTDEVILGCAGNSTLRLSLPVCDAFTAPDAQPLRQAVKIKLFGLASGHSGAAIHLGHQNAILLCAALLWRLYQVMPFALVSMSGGGRANVIAKECEALIAVTDAQAAIALLKEEAAKLYPSLCAADRGMKVHVNRVGVSAPVLAFRQTGQLLRALSLVPNGVLERMPDEEFVLTSSNLGALELSPSGCSFVCMCRSMRMDALDRVCDRFRALAALCELSLEELDRSPAWEKVENGALARAYCDFYQARTGKPARGVVIHAGLECGLLQSRGCHPTEFISIGPEMHGIHTTAERLSLTAFAAFHALLTDFLQVL